VEPTCHRPCRQASRAHWPSGVALPCCSMGRYNTPVSEAEAAAALSERPRVTGEELAALPTAVSHGAAPPCRSCHAAPAAIPPHRPERPSPRAHPACSSLSRAAVTPPNRAPRQSPLSRAATPLYRPSTPTGIDPTSSYRSPRSKSYAQLAATTPNIVCAVDEQSAPLPHTPVTGSRRPPAPVARHRSEATADSSHFELQYTPSSTSSCTWSCPSPRRIFRFSVAGVQRRCAAGTATS
jgi:hypothetical protein